MSGETKMVALPVEIPADEELLQVVTIRLQPGGTLAVQQHRSAAVSQPPQRSIANTLRWLADAIDIDSLEETDRASSS